MPRSRSTISLAKPRIEETLRVEVDYHRSMAEMIVAGEYDDVNNETIGQEDLWSPRRPQNPAVQVELVSMRRGFNSEGALKFLGDMGLRPSNFRELLAIGETFPNLQRQYHIAALGQLFMRRTAHAPMGGDYLEGGVPTLTLLHFRGHEIRALHLRNWSEGWSDGWQFAGVRDAQ